MRSDFRRGVTQKWDFYWNTESLIKVRKGPMTILTEQEGRMKELRA
jgi:hypothetical protein